LTDSGKFDRLESRVDRLASDTQTLTIEVSKLGVGQTTILEKIGEDRLDRKEYRAQRESAESEGAAKLLSDPRMILVLIAVAASVLGGQAVDVHGLSRSLMSVPVPSLPSDP